MKIILVGFMGCGKSSVAPILSEALHLGLVEMDQLILEKSGFESVAEIFSARGEEFFRVTETEVCKDLSDRDDLVVSTGGGTIFRPENLSHLRASGSTTVIFLRTSFEECMRRLHDDNARPLLADREKAQQLFQGRESGYQHAADFCVETDSRSPSEIAELIVSRLGL